MIRGVTPHAQGVDIIAFRRVERVLWCAFLAGVDPPGYIPRQGLTTLPAEAGSVRIPNSVELFSFHWRYVPWKFPRNFCVLAVQSQTGNFLFVFVRYLVLE